MRVLAVLSFLFLLSLAVAGGGGLYLLYYYGRGLPDYQQLADYQPPVVTRIHAGDGRLLAEFAKQKRIFVPIAAMPKRVPSTRSKAVGVPPRCKCPNTVTRVS